MVRRALAGFFGAESHPVNLAIARILVFGLLLDQALGMGIERYVMIPEVLRVPPDGWEPFFHWIPFDRAPIVGAKILSSLFCVLAIVGWQTRTATALATGFSIYLLAVPELFGKVDHRYQHLIWFAALLAAGPSGDALSVDRWLARRKGIPPAQPSVAHALPLRFMWLLMGVIYFFPGLAKLRAAPEWFAAPNLEFIMYGEWLRKGFVPPLRIDLIPGATRAAAVGVAAFEISFVLLVLFPRTRLVAAFGGLAFHTANSIFLRIHFVQLMACYAVLIDWHAVFGRIRSRFPGPEPPSQPRAAADERGVNATRVVGVALLLAGIWCGARDVNSWPVSRYPKFESVRTRAEVRFLVAVVESADGGAHSVHVPLRYHALERILETEDPELRSRKLEGLRELVKRRGLKLRYGDRFRLYDVTRSSRPEEGGREIRRVLLLDTPLEQPAGSSERSLPHLLLVSLDTLRADHLSAYGYARDTSPRLAELARRSVVFERAYSQSNKTAPSHMTLMTSLYPAVHRIQNPGNPEDARRLSGGLPTLAEALRAAGYRTYAIHAGGMLGARFGFDRGFESYESERDLSELFRKARERVAAHEAAGPAPLFLFLHTYEIHAPYAPPAAHGGPFLDPVYAGSIPAGRAELIRAAGHERQEQKEWFWSRVDEERPEDVRRLRNLYDGGIHYTDAQLGGFLDWLRSRPTWQRMLVVVLSDHGEEFGEHGEFQHTTLHREALHVPLIVRFPHPQPALRPRRVADVVRLIDVAPTLYDYLEILAPGPLQGRSLLPLLRDEAKEPRDVLSELRPNGPVAFQSGEWKLIRADGQARLFRISLDPGELEDRAAAEPQRVAALEARLDRLLAESEELRAGVAPPTPVEIDSSWRRALEALGYLRDSEGTR